MAGLLLCNVLLILCAMANGKKEVVAWIGLGSNLGNRRVNLARAVEDLSLLPGTSLLAASSIYRSKPEGDGFSKDFFNAAVGVRTELSAEELLEACLDIENTLGRDRSRPDRTIDLDILLYGNEVFNDADLTVPHPRMSQRRFVLEPLAEIAPDVLHPVERATIAELHSRLGEQQQVERLAQPLFPLAGC